MSRFSRIAAGALLVAVAASPAHAQLGGLMKRAAAKVVEKKAEERLGEQVRQAGQEELTEELLQSMVAGAKAAAPYAARLDRLAARKDSVDQALSKLQESQGKALSSQQDAYNTMAGKTEECRNEIMSQRERERDKLMEQKKNEMMSDPAKMGQMQIVAMKYGQQMATAQQKGDGAELMRVQRAMMKEITGMDLFEEAKKDTAAATGKCGALPKKSALMLQEEALRAKQDSLASDLRVLDGELASVASKASGLDPVKFGQARERITSILRTLDTSKPSGGSAAEIERVRAHRAELQAGIR